MGIDEDILGFEERGYSFEKSDVGANVITPSGSVYDVSDLYDDGCPLCAGYLRDSKEEEVTCSHLEEDVREIEESKIFKDLIGERKRLKFCEVFGVEN